MLDGLHRLPRQLLGKRSAASHLNCSTSGFVPAAQSSASIIQDHHSGYSSCPAKLPSRTGQDRLPVRLGNLAVGTAEAAQLAGKSAEAPSEELMRAGPATAIWRLIESSNCILLRNLLRHRAGGADGRGGGAVHTGDGGPAAALQGADHQHEAPPAALRGRAWSLGEQCVQLLIGLARGSHCNDLVSLHLARCLRKRVASEVGGITRFVD